MHRLATSFVLGFHGCRDDVAERVLVGEAFKASDNQYDWLGPGIYFWQSNPERAHQFAREKLQREKSDWQPAVVGAVIELGFCLDLATATGLAAVRSSHDSLVALGSAGNLVLPTNAGGSDLLLRKLDCAVIRLLHDARAESGDAPYDSVIGVFVEGAPVYPGAGIREKTHIQVCVRNPRMIKGVFRVNELLSLE